MEGGFSIPQQMMAEMREYYILAMIKIKPESRSLQLLKTAKEHKPSLEVEQIPLDFREIYRVHRTHDLRLEYSCFQKNPNFIQIQIIASSLDYCRYWNSLTIRIEIRRGPFFP